MSIRRFWVTNFDTVDYFFDESLVDDPYPYFDHLRSTCPVTELPLRGVLAVTGYEEAGQVFRDPATFSSCNAVAGPFPERPFEPEGDDVSALIEQHRHQFPMHEYLITQDPPAHTAQRGLLMRLLTPKRMKENEAFMWGLADRQIDEFIGKSTFEVLHDYAQPFALLVIADLLGVPEEDHRAFKSQLGVEHPQPLADGDTRGVSLDPLAFLIETFSAYIEERRREPRHDVLTQLAAATYPDGTTPDPTAVARTAAFVFAAGQDTTARLLSSALQIMGDHPEIQALLRNDRTRIPNFIEEVLRMEGPVKSMFRTARVTTAIGGVEVPAGTTVLILPGAANRDPGSSRSRTSSVPTDRALASTSRSGVGSTPAPAVPSRASRCRSASSDSSTAPPTSRSRRTSTDLPTLAATSTTRRSSSAA